MKEKIIYTEALHHVDIGKKNNIVLNFKLKKIYIFSLSPVPAGHYPDELLPSGPARTAAWDDVRVRYQYYKDLGYLRDLSLDDYVKWEEWWYKYQDWLTNERHYEHWLSSQRRRRKRIPATQRLN